MALITKLIKFYFDYAYNPVYDFTTARLHRYHELQENCIDKLELKENDRVLCVGLGTGNEALRILKQNSNVKIVGVDYSHTALRKAYKKASRLGKEIDIRVMDARCLEFITGSFDKALCIHVMDFVKEKEKVTSEILRVLRDGGRFVITYPSDKEGPRLAVNLLSDSVRHGVNSGKHGIRAFGEPLAQMLVGIIYLPLLFRPKQKSYSCHELEAIISKLTNRDFQIEEDAVYQDFIVYGRK